jgi:glycosyltransferase involved in cell wall biosynthesis
MVAVSSPKDGEESERTGRRIKRIAILTFEFYPKSAGVANATLSLAHALDAKRVDVLVIAPREKDEWKAQEDLSDRIHVLRVRKLVKKRFPLNRAFLIFRALMAIRKYQPDVIIGQMLNWGGAIAALAGKVTGRLAVGYAHASWDTEGCYGRLNKWLRRFCLRHCDLIVATNTFHARALDVVEPGVRKKTRVVPNAAAFPVFTMSRHEARDRLRLPGNTFDLICVGRLVPSKGITYLIEAMHQLPGDTRLHILGDGPLREELSGQMNHLGLCDRVTFHGAVDRQKVFMFMKGADALVFPALWEGFSMTPLEAMYIGTPVIATSVGGLADMVKDRKTGLVVECGDPDDIARAVTELRSNPGLRESITEQAKERVLSEFSGEAVAQKLLTILEAHLKE